MHWSVVGVYDIADELKIVASENLLARGTLRERLSAYCLCAVLSGVTHEGGADRCPDALASVGRAHTIADFHDAFDGNALECPRTADLIPAGFNGEDADPVVATIETGQICGNNFGRKETFWRGGTTYGAQEFSFRDRETLDILEAEYFEGQGCGVAHRPKRTSPDRV